MAKFKVVLSAGNKADLENMINQFFYSNNYYISDDLKIKNKKSEYKGNLQIRIKKDRWQVIREDV